MKKNNFILISGKYPAKNKTLREFTNLGLKVIRCLDEKKIPSNAYKASYIVCNSLFLHHSIYSFPNLVFIHSTSSGIDNFNLEEISKNNIGFYSSKGIYSVPISEFVILKILEILKNSKFFYQNQINKVWQKSFDLCDLYSLKAVIYGFGSIGKEVAKRLQSFNVYTIGINKEKVKSTFLSESHSIINADEILKIADILIITLPLTEQTVNYFDFNRLNIMKKESIIINVSRGKVLNTKDLIYFLKLNKFKGVALDVFENEPLEKKSPLWEFERVFITPHNSYFSKSNDDKITQLILSNIKKHL